MLAKAFAFILLLGVSAVLGAPANSTSNLKRACGSTPDADKVDALEAAFSAEMTATGITDQTVDAMRVTIPVYFHVIRKDRTLPGGNVPDSQIKKQIKVLNEGFKKAGLKFKLKKTTRTTNANWFKWSDAWQTEMKNNLKEGGKGALNVYSVGFEESGLLGYATWPADYASNPKDDGVVILYSSMPGGTAVPYHQGKTLTHEVGHWTGLFHTFQGGCDGLGDMVDDTPAEAVPAWGCPTGSDTCPTQAGLDPIHNFMDYSDDPCMDEFTKGQVKRLKCQIRIYRGL